MVKPPMRQAQEPNPIAREANHCDYAKASHRAKVHVVRRVLIVVGDTPQCLRYVDHDMPDNVLLCLSLDDTD